MKTTTKLWIFIAVLALVSPLGLLLPEYLKSGSAWGEWSGEELSKLSGYLPEGLAKLSGLWNAPMPDYSIGTAQDKGPVSFSIAYVISAITGIAVIVIVIFIWGRFFVKKGNN